ncbi:acetyltransferase [Kitasatospora sp. MMS16-BH015]|uniref:GNAT family N-acetyltransferase n=1 Tax=Kitasatospora sp. MMS16-BH015 TaxID=2018025 RepID=UPI000CA2D2DC|nr:GNAT family N-acetyltransferase [Kitasatospora sp. MMS16-BH015]AUG78167.1 acetyltransferase [Kitasatospora sp. MMS16-BH015]
MHILSYPEAAVPPALRAQVWALQEEAWPSGDPDPGLSHDPELDPQTLLLVDEDGQLLAALDLLTTDFEHAGRVFRALGLSTVATYRAHQGRGHGRRLVEEALARIRRSGADLGLFTCDHRLRPFYEGAGWQPLPGSVILGGTPEDPFPSDSPGFAKTVMADFCSPEALAARPAFENARIPLYPGLIDRLW